MSAAFLHFSGGGVAFPGVFFLSLFFLFLLFISCASLVFVCALPIRHLILYHLALLDPYTHGSATPCNYVAIAWWTSGFCSLFPFSSLVPLFATHFYPSDVSPSRLYYTFTLSFLAPFCTHQALLDPYTRPNYVAIPWWISCFCFWRPTHTLEEVQKKKEKQQNKYGREAEVDVRLDMGMVKLDMSRAAKGEKDGVSASAARERGELIAQSSRHLDVKREADKREWGVNSQKAGRSNSQEQQRLREVCICAVLMWSVCVYACLYV